MTNVGGLFKPKPDESKEAFKRRVTAALGIGLDSREVANHPADASAFVTGCYP